jgi:uncharacterized protein involved in outer membrane biogenesis
MRSMPRGCLVAIGAVLALLLIVGLVVRRALAPDQLRAVAESQLSTVLGQPVKIGTMDVDILPTPSVTGGDITTGGTSAGRPPRLGIAAVRIVPVLGSLFSSQVLIDRVEIRGLTFNVRRTREGRWLLPIPTLTGAAPAAVPARAAAPSSSAPAGQGDAAATTVDVREILLEDGRLVITDDVLRSPAGSADVATIGDVAATVRRDGATTRLDGLTAALGATKITGSGSASREGLRLQLAFDSLRQTDLPQVFALLGAAPPAGLVIEGDKPLALDLRVGAGGDLAATGRVTARRIALGTLTLTSFDAPIALARDVLTLDPLAFKAYGGDERGRVTANVGVTPVALSLRSRIDGLDVNQFLSANTTARDVLLGTGRLNANLKASSSAPLDTMTGTVDAVIGNGVIRNFPLLSAINSALRITESSGSDTKFESLSATLGIGGRRARTNNLRLAAGELTVLGAGSFGFDQTLDVDGTAVFSRAKSQELIARVRELSGLKNSRGEVEVPLRVTGSASRPNFQIDVEKILSQALQKEMKRQLDKGLKKLFKF